MDLMYVKGWTISDNAFIGIRGKSGRARGAVFIWVNSEDVLIENNIFVHCDKAIGLGNPHAQERAPFHIKDSIIKNNTIIGGCNKAIEIDYGNNILIESNNICSEDRKDYHAIQVLNISKFCNRQK